MAYGLFTRATLAHLGHACVRRGRGPRHSVPASEPSRDQGAEKPALVGVRGREAHRIQDYLRGLGEQGGWGQSGHSQALQLPQAQEGSGLHHTDDVVPQVPVEAGEAQLQALACLGSTSPLSSALAGHPLHSSRSPQPLWPSSMGPSQKMSDIGTKRWDRESLEDEAGVGYKG